jgi:hypothetical protein
MSANSSLKAAGFSSSKDGTTVQIDNSLVHQPNSDWIGTSLLTARALAAGVEYLDFPYVRSVFRTAVVLLETVEVQY